MSFLFAGLALGAVMLGGRLVAARRRAGAARSLPEGYVPLSGGDPLSTRGSRDGSRL